MLAAIVQARAQQTAAMPDTIRGVVFDSLLHQPIPEATVQANAGVYSTLTDKEGRFTLISPEKITRVPWRRQRSSSWRSAATPLASMSGTRRTRRMKTRGAFGRCSQGERSSTSRKAW